MTASAAQAAELPARIAAKTYVPAATYPGIQHLHFEYGPDRHRARAEHDRGATQPAEAAGAGLPPARFRPNLIYTKSHKVPRVDVIHLHHGVWLINGYPTFAAGEEKTTSILPQGYGYHYKPSDGWIMNYMIHNLTPTPTKVFITYDIDFIPDSAPAAR